MADYTNIKKAGSGWFYNETDMEYNEDNIGGLEVNYNSLGDSTSWTNTSKS